MMIGALIREGVHDWQIFQQHDGYAEIKVNGTWNAKSECKKPCVYVCLKNEDTGEPVIWWKSAQMDGEQWSITLHAPLGGLYQIETCLTCDGSGWSEWAVRGDIRSHIGVGDLFVIAGQSNSAGYGKDTIYDPPELGVHILKNNGSWALATHPLQDSTGCMEEPINMDSGNTGHSLYLSFAKYMKRELGYPIGLIQTAKGGAALSEWEPERGPLYQNMLRAIKLAGGNIRAMVWYQGCSDAMQELCQSYRERFMQFLKALRYATGIEKLPTFVFQLNRCIANSRQESDFFWGMIREQQRSLNREENVFVLPTNDCNISDAHGHNAAKANMSLGERLAKSALHHLYGKSYMCDAPNLIAAEKCEQQEVLLQFENVYDKLDTFAAPAERIDFCVCDNDGIVPITAYKRVEPNQICLTLGRTLSKNCMIHGGYEMDLKKLIPFDYATHLPMLSFYGVQIMELKNENNR